MRITLDHIAARAKVSKMTTSAILSGRYIPQRPAAVARAKNIHKIAQQLGYRPNIAARATSTGRFDNIALLISADMSRSTIPPRLLGAIHDALAQRRLQMTLAKLSDDAATDDAFVPRILREWSADGLLVNYHKSIPDGMEALIDASGHPAIWLNCRRDHDCIRPDDFDASLRLTQHLLHQGHRRIAYVDMHCSFRHQPDEHYSQYERWEGYAAAMRQAGLQPRRIDFAHRAWKNRAMFEFWSAPQSSWLAASDRPTAIVAYSDAEVGPVMLAAQKLGLNLPDDLAIVSFGEGRSLVHGLRIPSMGLPHEVMGQQAVAMLLERIGNPRLRQPTVKVPFTFELNPMSVGGAEPPVDPPSLDSQESTGHAQPPGNSGSPGNRKTRNTAG